MSFKIRRRGLARKTIGPCSLPWADVCGFQLRLAPVPLPAHEKRCGPFVAEMRKPTKSPHLWGEPRGRKKCRIKRWLHHSSHRPATRAEDEKSGTDYAKFETFSKSQMISLFPLCHRMWHHARLNSYSRKAFSGFKCGSLPILDSYRFSSGYLPRFRDVGAQPQLRICSAIDKEEANFLYKKKLSICPPLASCFLVCVVVTKIRKDR